MIVVLGRFWLQEVKLAYQGSCFELFVVPLGEATQEDVEDT